MTTAETSTDGELLSRFVGTGEQAPFEELVARYAPLVLKVCRDVLGQTHDAEDAAQAVFLTLAQKASGLRNRETIAGWLHRVAWHVAMRAREARGLRSHREREAAEMNDRNRQQPAESEQIRLLLHGELESLPEKYRLPLILHHLEGYSEQETAALLGCKVGTLSGRLSRGRNLLRNRLVRRGVAAVSVTALVAAMSRDAVASTVPTLFVTSTAKSATLVAAGHAAVDTVVSAKAAALSQAAMKTLLMAQFKTAAAVLVAASLVVTGVSVTAYRAIARGPQGAGAPDQPTTTPAAATNEEKPADPDESGDVATTTQPKDQPPAGPPENNPSPEPTSVTLTVPGLTCPINCPPKVEQALRGVPGTANVEVDVSTKTITCDVHPDEFDAEDAIKALADAGYAGATVLGSR